MYVLPFVPVLQVLLEHGALLKLCKVCFMHFGFTLATSIPLDCDPLNYIGCDVGEVQVNFPTGILVQ